MLTFTKIEARSSYFPLLAAVLWAPSLHAFPPAPFHTIYGDVRDEQGVLIAATGAAVVLSQNGVQKMRETLTMIDGADYNYQLRMRMDMGRSLTSTYSSLVVAAASNYSLAIDIGGVHYLPIEITTTPPKVGAPAARVRLDLTLGVDSDGDGLPDAWKEAQLYHAGYRHGDDGWDLSRIDRDGDFDGDGISNWQEYIAGTYATDASSTIKLEIKEKLGENVRLETYTIYGKNYALESSTDLEKWTSVSFSKADPAGENAADFMASLVSTSTGITSFYVKGTEAITYYRLKIR